MERVFLGWDRPGLAGAVDYLVRRDQASVAARRPGTLDLSGVIVAVPGSRAGRRLLELMVQRAEEGEKKGTGPICAKHPPGHSGKLDLSPFSLVPPRILTIGRLPEELYQEKRPFADELVQHLAWVAALRQTDPARLRSVVPAPPAEDDLAAWLSLAEMLARLHRELAAEAQDFTDVANCVGEKGDRSNLFKEPFGPFRQIGPVPFFSPREGPRWQTLAEVQQRYLRTLDAVELWDKQTARLYAIRHGECATTREVVLVGTADLNRAQQLMLDQIAPRVTALVVAPQGLADRFDAYGSLRPGAWRDAAIELRPEQIELAEAPADQASAVVRALAGFGGRYSGEEVTVGVPDESLVPYLEQGLRQAGVAVRYGVGTPVRRSGPCRLLEAVADYLDGRQFSAFASLVRHPVIEAWLAAPGLAAELRGDWLTELDDYQRRHLPHRAEFGSPGDADSRRPENPGSPSRSLPRRVYATVERLLAGFGQEKRPLAAWGEPLAGFLAEVLGSRPLNPGIEPDRTILQTCDAVRDVLRGLQAIPETLMPRLDAVESLRLVLRELDSALIPAPPMPGAIEMLGWLELPLDDAPALVVTGLSDGIVPASVNADLFLPDQLRLALGIEDNDRRYARDAYALSVLAASRKELKLISGRRSAEGEPLLPSRLLFACDEETIVRRVKAFFSGQSDGPPKAHGLQPMGLGNPSEPGLAIPRPRPLPEPVASMRVTEFRDYLACPYRYYLRHRLGLGAVGDDAEELDGMAFGSLAHDVFKAFGSSAAAASTDAEEVAAQLSASLDGLLRRQFGGNPLAVVLVQIEQLRGRLDAFARWQAQWAAEGWRIKYVEVGEDRAKAAFVVDGREMGIRGRIDRIDYHADKDQWVIFDYKTSDAAKTPEQTHVDAGRWVDLQLPLYRHLARCLGIHGGVKLGFIVVGKDTNEVGGRLADWTEADLQSADRAAEDVIRKVWAGKFWPPTSPAPPGFDELDAICQVGQFSAARLTGGKEEGGEG